jgi:hypothetical protein
MIEAVQKRLHGGLEVRPMADAWGLVIRIGLDVRIPPMSMIVDCISRV